MTGRSVNPVHSKWINIINKKIHQGIEVPTFQKSRNRLQLRDVILGIAAVLNQQREHVLVLAARMRRVHFRQLFENNAPGLDLLYMKESVSVATRRHAASI